MADVTMPQLGETVTEGTITKWYKSVGDQVARDEPLFEVSTDKVDSEVPSPADGVLTAILVEEGDTVDVGAKLAVIGGEASANGAAAAPAEAAPGAATSARGAPEAVEPQPPSPPSGAGSAPAVTATFPTGDHTGDPSPAPSVEQPPPATLGRSAEGSVLKIGRAHV